MAEGILARWLKKDGEWVEAGEPLVEVETDKIIYAMDTPSAGLLLRVAVEESVVKVGGLLGYLLARGEAPPAADVPAESVPVVDETPYGDFEPLPMRGIRQVISDNMLRSLQRTAQYTICVEADVTELEKLRKQLFESKKLRVSLVDVFIKACAEVLKRHPRLNAVWVGDEVRICRDINISFAVALDDGLVVPVVRDADKLTLPDIAHATRDLAQRARSSKLTLAEIKGGTFCVTAPGFVDACTPILNYPECGILGIGRVVEKPVVYQGQIAVRSMTTLSLSLDHRVIDGAPAAAFLRRLHRLVEEQPAHLFDPS
jgi:pyruvate dehydrogenase E2 component (dihydrolipoamide acetyltransferase)